MTCRFFRSEISKLYTSRFRKCLKPFLNQTSLFICLIHAHKALISGRIVLDLLIGPKQDIGDRQMAVCVDDNKAASALMHHLVTFEGYEYAVSEATKLVVNMADALSHVEESVFDPSEGIRARTTGKRIQTVVKSSGEDTIFIDVYSFEIDDLFYDFDDNEGPPKLVR